MKVLLTRRAIWASNEINRAKEAATCRRKQSFCVCRGRRRRHRRRRVFLANIAIRALQARSCEPLAYLRIRGAASFNTSAASAADQSDAAASLTIVRARSEPPCAYRRQCVDIKIITSLFDATDDRFFLSGELPTLRAFK